MRKTRSIRQDVTRRKLIHILLVFLAFSLAVVFAFPLYWLVRSTLVSNQELLHRPPVYFPTAFHVENFSKALARIDFMRQLYNSVSIAVPYVLGTLITTSFAGYAFARLRFPLRGMWFTLVISTMMLPSAVTLLPQYSLYGSMGLANKAALMTAAAAGASAWLGGHAVTPKG